MKLLPNEPDLGPWQAVPAADVVTLLQQRRPAGRSLIVAIDGRGAGGKTTTAGALCVAANEAAERAVCLSTDDIAWRQARFDWDYLLADNVLVPVRAGRGVCWRPPAWVSYGRDGAVEVPAGTTMLFVEGVGAARRQLASLLDFAVWVQSDIDLAFERGMIRDCALYGRTREEAETSWAEWMTEELPHLAADRPWERADLVVARTDLDIRVGENDLVVGSRSPALRPNRK